MKSLFCAENPKHASNPAGTAEIHGDGTGGAHGKITRANSNMKPLQKRQDKIRTWGNNTFKFNFRTQGESMYQTSKSR